MDTTWGGHASPRAANRPIILDLTDARSGLSCASGTTDREDPTSPTSRRKEPESRRLCRTGSDPSQKTQQDDEDDYETEPLPPGIPRAPVRSPICLVVESGVLVDLGGLQLAVGNRLLQA